MSAQEVAGALNLQGALYDAFLGYWDNPAQRELIIYTYECYRRIHGHERVEGYSTAETALVVAACNPASYLTYHAPDGKSFLDNMLSLPSDKVDYLKAILLAVQAGGQPNQRVTYRCIVTTPLGMAAREGRVDLARKLVELGADKDSEANLTTPLQFACEERRTKMVAYLLSEGANPNWPPKMPPLCCALRGKDWGLVLQLISAGADPSLIPGKSLACYVNNATILEQFLDHTGYQTGDLLYHSADMVYGRWLHPGEHFRGTLDMLMRRPVDRAAAGKYREKLDKDYPQ